MKLLRLLLLIAGMFSFCHLSSREEHPTVFAGLLIREFDGTVPYFLKSVEKLDYEKDKITLHVHLINDNEEVASIVKEWIGRNRETYAGLELIDDTSILIPSTPLKEANLVRGTIQDSILRDAKESGCSYCLILPSDVFLEPRTLSHLVALEKPVIVPMLRPMPEANDHFRNFYCAISEEGYFNYHPDYMPIARREKKGTFEVPCVQMAYLISTAYADRLSFTQDPVFLEFVTFSNNASKQAVPQFLCNEQEFGFFLRFKKETPINEQRSFIPVHPDSEVTPSLVKELLEPYYIDNSHLEIYAEHFNTEDYTLFRIRNQDLFYLDDIYDLIKLYVIKEGKSWEEHFIKRFKKYAKPGTVALDIGGHIGTHSLNLSRIVENGTVHVFEPQSKMFCELAVNMHLNGCSNVVLHPFALGAEAKPIEMHIPKEDWQKSYPDDFINEGHGTVKVTKDNSESTPSMMRRLDDLHIENISFIKMDVEGFEMEVINGGLETIANSKPVMIIEIFDNELKNRKIRKIEKMGYSCTRISGDDYLFLPKKKQRKRH